MITQEAIERYYAAKALKWMSKDTRRINVTVLTPFAAAYPILPGDPESIEAWLAARDVADYTRFTYYRVLKTFYRWAAKRLQVANPMEDVEAPSSKRPRPRTLSLEELRRLLAHPGHPEMDRLLLEVLADTAIRIGECASILPAWVQPDAIHVSGKTGEREIPCSPDLCQRLLAAAAAPDRPVFAYQTDALRRHVTKAFKRAGFSGRRIGPHTLRHTFATLWEGSDADLQMILGHSSPAMTLWYRQFRIERAKRDHAKYAVRRQALGLNG